MKRLALILLISLGLSGCAALTKLEAVYTDLSGSTISPQNVYIAANAFDALKVTATQYFVYCRTHLTVTVCSAANRRTVLTFVRSGTAARNQLETYLVAGTAAPAQIYQTLMAAVNGLKSSASAQGAVQ